MTDPVTGLTPKEQEVIKNSWTVPRQKPTESGIGLFKILFKNHPEYKQLFPFKDVPTEDLPKNKRFLAHANSVIYSFTSIVDAIDDPELLIPILERIGESHKSRKVSEKALFDLKTALLELFTTVYSEEELAAWKKTLEVVFTFILKGFNQ